MNWIILLFAYQSLIWGQVEAGLGSPRWSERERHTRVLRQCWFFLPSSLNATRHTDPEVQARVRQAIGVSPVALVDSWRTREGLMAWMILTKPGMVSPTKNFQVTALLAARPGLRLQLSRYVDLFGLRADPYLDEHSYGTEWGARYSFEPPQTQPYENLQWNQHRDNKTAWNEWYLRAYPQSIGMVRQRMCHTVLSIKTYDEVP